MGSIHNELTGRSGFVARAIRNALQIEDAEKGVERLSETLNPTINLWQLPEWALLRGERIWGVEPSQPAVAGEFSAVGIFNPANSGLMVVVDEISMPPSATTVSYEASLGPNVVFAATSTPNSRDSRVALLSGVQCGSFAHHSVAHIGSGALIAIFGVGTNTYSRYPVNVVLSPGFFFQISATTANAAVQCNFFGRERPAFAGELTARA